MNKVIPAVLLVCLVILGIIFLTYNNSAVKNSASEIITTESPNVESNKTSSENIIAGTVTPYSKFNQTDYEKALLDSKTIFLEFYASWCPICRAQEPELISGFNSVSNPNVVGFRVNYNDPETDDFEKELAKQFGITYQHTHVVIKDGKEVYKSSGELTKEDFEKIINQYAQ